MVFCDSNLKVSMILSSEDLLSVLTKLHHVLESQTEENRKKKKNQLLLNCLKAFSNFKRTCIHVGHLLSIELTKITLGLSALSYCAHS